MELDDFGNVYQANSTTVFLGRFNVGNNPQKLAEPNSLFQSILFVHSLTNTTIIIGTSPGNAVSVALMPCNVSAPATNQEVVDEERAVICLNEVVMLKC